MNSSPAPTRGRAWRNQFAWSAVGFALIGPLAFAFVGLALAAEWPHATWWPWALLSMILFALLAWFRDRLVNHAGTLYYVQALSVGLPDLHDTTLRGKFEEHVDIRVVRRTMGHDPGSAQLTVEDHADTLTDLARDLQQTMNDDSARTKFHIAPNLLWPAAVAAGYDMWWWTTTDLLELSAIDDADSTWSLHSDASADGVPGPTLVVPDRPQDGLAVVCVTLTSLTLGSIPGLADGAVWRVDLPGSPTGDARKKFRLGTHITGSDKAQERTVVSVNASVHQMVAATRAAIHLHPNEPVVMRAAIPKTVAFAFGRALRDSSCEQPGCDQPACVNPWRVLVPINTYLSANRQRATDRPMRVHHLQPSADDINQMLAPWKTTP